MDNHPPLSPRSDEPADAETHDCSRCKKYRRLAFLLYRQLQSHDEYWHFGRVGVEAEAKALMKSLGMRRMGPKRV